MNRFGLLLTVFLVSAFSFAAEQNASAFRKGAIVGSGLSASPLGGFEASSDFVTPRLFSVHMESQNRSLAFALFLKGGIGFDARLNFNIPASAGMRVTTQAETISPYSQVGADFMYAPTGLGTRTTSFGMIFTLGCDFIVIKGAIDPIMGANDSSFFVEANVRLFHSDATPGTNVLNGFTPRLGYRAHF